MNTEEHDLLKLVPQRTIPLWDGAGYVELFDMTPRLVPEGRTADLAVVRNARISTGNGDKSLEQDAGLIHYLYTNGHTSPFETVIFKFRIQLPIFVERQLIRHRTASVNEESHRYTTAKHGYYLPPLRLQSKSNRQGSQEGDVNPEAQKKWDRAKALVDELHDLYNDLVTDHGVSREVARCILPVAETTSMIYIMDLHNLFKLLGHRMASAAQLEIRQLARAMYRLIQPTCPASCKEFEIMHPELVQEC